VGGSSARYCFSVAWSMACWCIVLLCERLNVSGGDILFLCSGLDDRSARPMTGDGRKRGGMKFMWSFDVKLSGALSQRSRSGLQLQVSKWLRCGTLRAAEMVCLAFPSFNTGLVVSHQIPSPIDTIMQVQTVQTRRRIFFSPYLSDYQRQQGKE
jgi:hypothetical protein